MSYHKSGVPGADELLYTALGGLGGIGSNLYVYGHKGKWLVVDFGIGFAQGTIPGVEVIFPDPTFLKENKDHIVGIIITHAHEDHVGAIPYIYDSLQFPIYTTEFTANFTKLKLAEIGLDKQVAVHVVETGKILDIGGFQVEFMPMTHSIPEPQGIKFHVPFGTVIHTGDWKVDTRPMIGDGMAVADIKQDNVFAIIGDSTNVMNKNYAESEGDVRDSIIELVGGISGGIAVTCFASNLARLESFILAAKHAKRKVVFVGKSLWRMLDCAKKSGYLQDIPPVYEAFDVKEENKSGLLYICTGSQGEWRAGLARVARGDHPNVQLGRGDTVIFSARCIPGNEISVRDIQNMLSEQGVDIITPNDAFVHASGHGSGAEISELYKHLKPKYVLPMHGETLHLERHAMLAKQCGVKNAFVLSNGDLMSLSADGVFCVDEVYTGVLALDGTQIGASDSSAIRQRQKMRFCGIAFVSIALDCYGSLVCEPQVHVEGLHFPNDADPLTDVAMHAIEKLSDTDVLQDNKVVETVRRAIRRIILDKTGKKTTVKIHILRSE